MLKNQHDSRKRVDKAKMTYAEYEFRKTISFKLIEEHVNKDDASLQPPNNDQTGSPKEEIKSKISSFIEKIESVSESIRMLFFFDKGTELSQNRYTKIKLTNNLEIKHPWLSAYTKTQFHDFLKEMQENGRKRKKYALGDVSYLELVFKERLNEWLDIVDRLKELNKVPLETQRRKREFAFCFRQLRKRSNLEFMREFVKSIHNSNKASYQNYDREISVDERLDALNKKIKETEKELRALCGDFLPAETLGLELLRGTFNYHTLNRTPKEYDDEIKRISESLDEQISHDLLKRRSYGDKRVLFDCSEGWFKEIGFSKNQDWTLDAAYAGIKRWKADRKKEFMEAIDKIKDIKEFIDAEHKKIEAEHPLFKSNENQMKSFIEKSISIERLLAIKNKIQDKKSLNDEEAELLSKHGLKEDPEKIRDRVTQIKRDRGFFFNFNTERSEKITEHYYELCELFKRIAQIRGKRLAKKKALEYEKIDAELLTHWAFILEEDKKHSLVLIPRSQGDGRNISCVKKFIEGQNNKAGDKTLCIFQSLTLRALEKLCFKQHHNTFRKEIEKELKSVPYPYYKRKFYEKRTEIEGDKKLVDFYQEVLRTSYAKREISKYPLIEEITKRDYNKSDDPLAEFRKDLEKCCYVKRIVGDEGTLSKLKNEYSASVFLIDSLDLRTERQNKPERIEEYKKKYEKRGMDILRTEHNQETQKRHTLLWKEFWKDGNEHDKYPTRLNPEMRIFFRVPRESRVKKYGETSGSYDANKKNRFLKPQHTLATSFTLNAANKNMDFSWDGKKEIKDKIDLFNSEFTKNANRWTYGIDRGLKQLATLCIADLDKEKPDFPEITLYELNKDKYYHQDENRNHFGNQDKSSRWPIKNISNFIDKINDKDWFTKSSSKENACIDLTTAKVIKGHIIRNGDVQTLLNLKEISAKRKLYELFHQGKIDKSFKVEGSINKNTLIIKNSQEDALKDEKGNDVILYWLSDEQKNDFEEKAVPIIDDLNEYLKKAYPEPPVEKVNHLRDALTANMIGVIKFLHDRFPAKRISLENLDEPRPNQEIKSIDAHFNQSNQNISRRLEWALYRKFQSEGSVPPSIKQTILLKHEFKQTQFGIVQFVETKGTSSNCPNCNTNNGKSKGHYTCKECGFSSRKNGDKKGLIPLTDSDKVAAYNVAKRCRELLKLV